MKVTVLTSSTSAVSEPKSPNGPPQSGQAHSLGSIRLSIRSKCSGKCLRRVGCPFSGTTASMAGDAGIDACATLASSASRLKRHLLDTLEPFGGLPEAKAPQLGELELQVLDLPLLRAQIDALASRRAA